MLIRTMWTRLQDPDTAPSGGGSAAAAATPTPSAPASTPAVESTPASTAAPASGRSEGTPVDDFDFGALVDNANSPDDGDGSPPPKAAVTPPSVPPTAQTPVAATPPVATPPVAATPPVQPAGQPPVPASQTPTAPVEATPSVEPFNVEKHRAEFLPKLEALYKMTDQEVADFQTNPGEALPKLAARLHYETQLAVHQGILQILPHLMGNFMSGQREQQKHEDSFYGRWPKLKEAVAKDPASERGIQEAIRSYKALNPKASIQDVIEKAGLLAMISMGIPPEMAAAVASGAPMAPSAPVAPSMPARPAGVGASAHVPIPSTPGREQEGADLYGGIFEHWQNGG